MTKITARFDGLRNIVTALATSRSRAAGLQIATPQRLSRRELDDLEKIALVRAVAYELVNDSLTTIKIDGLGDALKPTLDDLRELRAARAFKSAGRKARHYGGAAIWMVCDGGGEDLSEPLDLSTVRRVKRLHVMDRFELTRATSDHGGAGYLDVDPFSDTFLQPEVYRYNPAGGQTQSIKIHSSRLIRFYGDEVNPREIASYDYWGAPVIESTLREFEQEYMAREGGAEALYEVGGKKLHIANLVELLTNPEGASQLQEILTSQQQAFSVLRSWLVGPGMDVVPIGAAMQGWDATYDRIAQAYAAAARMPISKLYGQPPGGLSSDDQIASENWSARCRSYQEDALSPAADQLLTVIFASSEGPTAGAQPDGYTLGWAPYKVPTSLEQAQETKTRVDALAVAVDRGAMHPSEMRQSLAELEGIHIDDSISAPAAASSPSPLEPEQPADDVEITPADADPAEPLQNLAMNGAQITAMVTTVEAVKEGRIDPASARAILSLGFALSEQEAARIVPNTQDPAKAPAPGASPALPTIRDDGADGETRSVMLAAYPPRAWADELASAGWVLEPAERLHITLVYVGDVPVSRLTDMSQTLREVLADPALGPIDVRVNGPAVFCNEEYAHVLLMSGLGLARLRTRLADALEARGLMGAQRHDFIPHLTVGYYSERPGEQFEESLSTALDSWTIETVELVSGDEHLDAVPLDISPRAT